MLRPRRLLGDAPGPDSNWILLAMFRIPSGMVWVYADLADRLDAVRSSIEGRTHANNDLGDHRGRAAAECRGHLNTQGHDVVVQGL